MTFDEEFLPISPVNFFQISADCHYLPKKGKDAFPLINPKNYSHYLLPDTSSLCSESSFASVALGWNEGGIEAFIQVQRPFKEACYPEPERGDSVELFIDTRDVKTAIFNTRFCHHFFFLPEALEGVLAGEITRFRTEDVHELCDSKELKVKSDIQKKNYSLNILIPAHCLHGYDPGQFDRLGFTYRINQSGGDPQHFSVVTEDYAIEQQPSLWSSLNLTISRS